MLFPWNSLKTSSRRRSNSFDTKFLASGRAAVNIVQTPGIQAVADWRRTFPASRHPLAPRSPSCLPLRILTLPADGIHGAGRGHEFRRVDLVAFPFAGDVAAHQRGDLLVRRAGADERLHVVFLDGEEAVAQMAIRGEPQAIAVQAEWPADRRDEAHQIGRASCRERV